MFWLFLWLVSITTACVGDMFGVFSVVIVFQLHGPCLIGVFSRQLVVLLWFFFCFSLICCGFVVV